MLILLNCLNQSLCIGDDKVVLLTVVGSSSNNEYGYQKSQLLKYLSIDNRLRYCINQGISCVIGTAYINDKTKRYLRTKLIRALKLMTERERSPRTKNNFTVYSARYVKVSWILQLLTIGINRIFYLDEDALIVKPFHPSSVFNSLSSSSCLGITPDIGQHSNRYNTGVMFIKGDSSSLELFKTLLKIHQHQQQFADNSDQLVFNRIIDNYNIHNISRVYNSLPKMEQPYWGLLGLENGDETPDLSYIVHFAGVYGGSKMYSGTADPVIMLLTMKEAVSRHRRTYKNEPSNKNKFCARVKESINICESIITLLNNCITTVFRSIDNVVAEAISHECLKKATKISKSLFSTFTQNELKTGLLIYTPPAYD